MTDADRLQLIDALYDKVQTMGAPQHWQSEQEWLRNTITTCVVDTELWIDSAEYRARILARQGS